MKKIAKAVSLCLSASLLTAISPNVVNAANLENDTAVAGISVALNNYYATSLSPEIDILEFLKPLVGADVENAVKNAMESTQADQTAASKESETSSEAESTSEEQTTEEANTNNYKSIYSKVAIAQVAGYVNVRNVPNTESEESIIGKIYNNCAATILETVDGEDGEWYKIQSGSLTGYIKASLFVTGDEAEAIAKSVGVVTAKVTAPALRLRQEASLEAEVLTQLALDSEYEVLGEEGDFVKIQVGDMVGYVFNECVELNVNFEEAISLEEEAAGLEEIAELQSSANYANKVYLQAMQEGRYADAGSAVEYVAELQGNVAEKAVALHKTEIQENAQAQREEALRLAQEAYAKIGHTATPDAPTQSEAEVTATTEAPTTQATTQAPAATQAPTTQAPTTQAPVTEAPTTQAATQAPTTNNSDVRSRIVSEAVNWVGKCNYSYGANNLTVGGAVDCSAFTSTIYKRVAGVTIPRTSGSQAGAGRTVSFDQLQPGDLVFYSGGGRINHVAIYIGNGQIVHAANPAVGIIISDLNYKAPTTAVSFF